MFSLPSRVLITAALPYVSGRKHIGNFAGSILPADIHARFRRQLGHDVAFVCATDEHGTPAETAALKAGLPPAEYCALAHAEQAAWWRDFGVSFDRFGRTSSAVCREEARNEFRALFDAGYIVETSRPVPWGTRSNRFLPDRFVEGECPHCGTTTKGDECSGCSEVLEAHELNNIRSLADPGEIVEIRSSRHLALNVPALIPEVLEYLEKSVLSEYVRKEAGTWLHEPRARDITRDTRWGVPVPLDGYEDKTLYVWFDAPIAYYGLVREWAEENGRNADDFIADESSAEWTAFLAKDNVAFHAVWFPAIVRGGRKLKLPDRISGHGWLLAGTGKFSTSSGVGVTVADALKQYSPSHWRWWLAEYAPENGQDSCYEPERFAVETNAALSDNVGNLVSRIGGLHERIGPLSDIPVFGTDEHALFREVEACIVRAGEAYAILSTRKACAAIREAWSLCNRYLADKAPWTTVKTNREEAALQVQAASVACLWAVRASAPVIPELSATLAEGLGDTSRLDVWPGLNGETIEETGLLHPKKIPPPAERIVFSPGVS